MNVLLISPKVKIPGLESLSRGYTIGGGILYLAAAVREAGHRVTVELGNENNIMHLIEKHSPEVVGVTCLTATYPIAKNVINLIKEYRPSILTVIGGHFATFMTREVFLECSVDYVLRGEGEIAFPLLLKQIESGNEYSIIEG
ncbi:MAG: cobalamin-dependent protein, partial [Candidatus Methanoperedens sp.]|nr:cobalamin-dependent protein [Candidatus Methanoperedens sp.]